MNRSIGIDIGTTFITVYHRENTVLRTRHAGQLAGSLQHIYNQFAGNDYCVLTGKGGQEIAGNMDAVYIDETAAVSCLLSAMNGNWFKNGNGQIMDIGASSLTLYTVKNGKLFDITRNTLCAAGTGLFLEEQAERLNIDLENPGQHTVAEPPLIASRCTVFAKSDLIHHQQEGRSRSEMWSGLCRSLAVSAVNTLFRGEEPVGQILICGGVSLNREVLYWFKRLYQGVQWIIPVNSASLIARGASLNPGKPFVQLTRGITGSEKKFKRMPALTLHRSNFPHMPHPQIDRHHNEIRFHADLSKTNEIMLGMDIGSTSTKLAALDADTYEPLLDIYGRTSGDPVGAARRVFSSFYDVVGGHEFPIKSFGTTGSGRKLVGKIFGADHIVNEISAQAKGTLYFSPDAETIFEIGGQDAKYIGVRDGYVIDANMNYVCAAGTGSFVAEQARKLGYDLRETGDITANTAPPVTSDRCTVFMEQDLRTLLREGFTHIEALAAVFYSVIRNYLHRVVGNRAVSRTKIFFQGATARNKGLVAALENLLDVEIIVSPFCHLTGAFGAALMAREFIAQHLPPGTASRFLGKNVLHMQIASRTETCRLCRNFCRIEHISRNPDTKPEPGIAVEFSWGYQCGRDPEEKIRKASPGYRLFEEREQMFYSKNEISEISGQAKNEITGQAKKGNIILVHALSDYTFQPLWVKFFNRLGYRVSLSGLTDNKIKKYSALVAAADFCFPVKVALGHTVKALEIAHAHSQSPSQSQHVFFPSMIADKNILPTAGSLFCPFVEAGASIVRSTLIRKGISTENLLSPVIDFRLSDHDIAAELYSVFKNRLDVQKSEIFTAFKDAYRSWQALTGALEKKGTAILAGLKETDQPVFILLGRPYNMHEKGLNLGIPEKIAAMGFTVIPIDMLELDIAGLAEGNYHHVFWKYGQRIMAAICLAGKYRNVFPIYLSNFNCGPDSFLLTYAEEQLQGKPMLVLELDEHSSDGGYLTRIEAFVDVVEAFMKRGMRRPGHTMPAVYTPARKADLNSTIWIPPLHYVGMRLFSAAFRGFGYDCRNLELENRGALELGKKYLRGSECLPMTLTLGNFLKQVGQEKPGTRHILFMPTAEGPCRFGQYNLLERIVFHRLGLHNVEILSPTSRNTYQGLPEQLRRQLMHALSTSDILFKMRSKVKPYERTRGDADELFEKSLVQLEKLLERKEKPFKIIKELASAFASIDTVKYKKPLVGIVGEIYIRCNSFANGDLVGMIESSGGEVWLSPLHEWVIYTAYMERRPPTKMNYKNMLKAIRSLVNNYYLFKIERDYYRAASEILYDRVEPHIEHLMSVGGEYVPEKFRGEAILTIGRAVLFARQGAAMVINAAPFGCMPGTLSSAILLEIKDKFKIPFLSLFYDGDLDINSKVTSLLKTLL